MLGIYRETQQGWDFDRTYKEMRKYASSPTPQANGRRKEARAAGEGDLPVNINLKGISHVLTICEIGVIGG